MSEAKKDGTPYLLKLKNLQGNVVMGNLWRQAERLGFKNGHYVFVGQNMRDTWGDGARDLGWQFAAPVGHGCFPDEWFEGFMELPK